MRIKFIAWLCIFFYILDEKVGKTKRIVSGVNIYIETVAHLQHLCPHLRAIYLREYFQSLFKYQLTFYLIITWIYGFQHYSLRRHFCHLHRHIITFRIIQETFYGHLLFTIFHRFQNVVYKLFYSLGIVPLRFFKLQIRSRAYLKSVLWQQLTYRFLHILLLVFVL